MSKKFRGSLIAFLFLVVALPAAAQMKSMRTVLDLPPSGGLAVAMDAASTDATDPCNAGFTSSKNPIKHDNAKAKCFWQQDGFALLKNTQMVSSGGSVAAATEVMSDFLYGWRVAFSTAVASEPDEEEAEEEGEEDGETEAEKQSATNLLQANGGNMSLSAAYPLYAKKYSAGGFAAVTYGRVGGTFAAFGDNGGTTGQSFEWSELNANAEWAVTTQTKLVTVSNIFNFEMYTNAGVIVGTKPFRNAIGIKADDSGAFLHGEVGANVKIGTAMVIGASYNYYTADGLDSGAILTVGFGR